MTKDDIIRMAREAGLCSEVGGIEGDAGSYYSYTEEIISLFQAAFKAGAAAEREACAKLIEAYPYWLGTIAKQEIAAAIRARTTT